MSAKKITFITGTDTGVGKTLLTALLLHHLRQKGIHALAMKPFCSGGRADVSLLQSLQRGELTDAEMNPFYFKEPLAPLIAAKKNRSTVRLQETIERIKHVEKKCDRLIVEGSGGLLVPLGKGFMIADLIGGFDCQIIVVARNRLGTINHTLLTIRGLQSIGKSPADLVVVLMDAQKPDLSSFTNQKTLSALLKPIKVLKIPFLGESATRITAVKMRFKKVKETLSALSGGRVAQIAERGSACLATAGSRRRVSRSND